VGDDRVKAKNVMDMSGNNSESKAVTDRLTTIHHMVSVERSGTLQLLGATTPSTHPLTPSKPTQPLTMHPGNSNLNSY